MHPNGSQNPTGKDLQQSCLVEQLERPQIVVEDYRMLRMCAWSRDRWSNHYWHGGMQIPGSVSSYLSPVSLLATSHTSLHDWQDVAPLKYKMIQMYLSSRLVTNRTVTANLSFAEYSTTCSLRRMLQWRRYVYLLDAAAGLWHDSTF